MEEYKEKLFKRKIKAERRAERLEQAGVTDDFDPGCSEDDDPNHELYIDAETKKLGGISTHIMYVTALCYRNVKNYDVSLQSYAKVMKTENQIGDYEKMIEKENFKNLDLKNVEGPGTKGWQVDMYSHF